MDRVDAPRRVKWLLAATILLAGAVVVMFDAIGPNTRYAAQGTTPTPETTEVVVPTPTPDQSSAPVVTQGPVFRMTITDSMLSVTATLPAQPASPLPTPNLP